MRVQVPANAEQLGIKLFVLFLDERTEPAQVRYATCEDVNEARTVFNALAAKFDYVKCIGLSGVTVSQKGMWK